MNTYLVTAYITQRIETIVVTDDEDMVSDLAFQNIDLDDYKPIHKDIDILEYETIHDANID